jgi:hypothetical protein
VRPRALPIARAASGLVGVALAAAALWTAPRWLVPRLAARSPRCLYAVPTSARVVALTLDDGPDPAHAPEILRLLDAHDARATFFLIADRIPGHEPLVADLVARGHELGHHMTRDEPSVRLSRAEFRRRCRRPVTCCGASRPCAGCVPPRAGTRALCSTTSSAPGYRCALGSVYPYDAHLPSARLAAAYVLANVRRAPWSCCTRARARPAHRGGAAPRSPRPARARLPRGHALGPRRAPPAWRLGATPAEVGRAAQRVNRNSAWWSEPSTSPSSRRPQRPASAAPVFHT